MNKLNILAISSLIAFSAGAHHVSLEPAKQDILVEEYTGILCSTCPHGDKVLDGFKDTYGERIHIISIHANKDGAVYSPSSEYYGIEAGEEICDYTNFYTYPAAWINRHHFEGRNAPAIQVDFWAQHVREEAALDAPLNLWARAVYSDDMKSVTVSVEGFFTGDYPNDNAFLSVAMVQHRIIGRQAGATNSKDYTHNSVLRAYLTPTWGEEITGCAKNAYFKRQYTFDIPEAIGILPVVPDDMEFIAFVTESRDDVVNSTACRPMTAEQAALDDAENGYDDEDPVISDDPDPEQPDDPDPENPDDPDYPVDAGVGGIGMDSTDAVWYDLSGRRVINPERGIYIRIQDGKPVKVVI